MCHSVSLAPAFQMALIVASLSLASLSLLSLSAFLSASPSALYAPLPHEHGIPLAPQLLY